MRSLVCVSLAASKKRQGSSEEVTRRHKHRAELLRQPLSPSKQEALHLPVDCALRAERLSLRFESRYTA